MNKLEKLLNSKSFCVLPWLSTTIHAEGNVNPCCIARTYSFGNTRQNSIETIMKSPEANAFRKQMLDGHLPKACDFCMNDERRGLSSTRMQFNQDYGHLLKPADVPLDGTLKDLNFAFIDFRFSNVCNYACIMCGPHDSNKWNQFAEKTGRQKLGTLNAFENKEVLLDFLKNTYHKYQYVHFAGGEPLLSEEHLLTLQFLLENKKTDLIVRYNTNLSKLSFGQTFFPEIWDKFKNIIIIASLDGAGQKGEFIRNGSNWLQIKENLRILKKYPKFDVQICATLMNLNAFDLPDMHKELLKEDLISTSTYFHYNILNYPRHLSAQSLSAAEKKSLTQHWRQYKDWICSLTPYNYYSERIESVIRFINETDLSHTRPEFEKYLSTYEIATGNRLNESIPSENAKFGERPQEI